MAQRTILYSYHDFLVRVKFSTGGVARYVASYYVVCPPEQRGSIGDPLWQLELFYVARNRVATGNMRHLCYICDLYSIINIGI